MFLNLKIDSSHISVNSVNNILFVVLVIV